MATITEDYVSFETAKLLNYGVQVDREDFINDFIKAMKDE